MKCEIFRRFLKIDDSTVFENYNSRDRNSSLRTESKLHSGIKTNIFLYSSPLEGILSEHIIYTGLIILISNFFKKIFIFSALVFALHICLC